MPSADFQRICRDMNNIGTEIIISRNDKEFVIQCYGDFANQVTVINCDEQFDGLVKGEYSLKYLNLFTKATMMCATVQIFQQSDGNFLTLKYNVANLGELNFYLATKVDD
jgi:proliferating cell nuclear antigen